MKSNQGGSAEKSQLEDLGQKVVDLYNDDSITHAMFGKFIKDEVMSYFLGGQDD